MIIGMQLPRTLSVWTMLAVRSLVGQSTVFRVGGREYPATITDAERIDLYTVGITLDVPDYEGDELSPTVAQSLHAQALDVAGAASLPPPAMALPPPPPPSSGAGSRFRVQLPDREVTFPSWITSGPTP